MESPSSVEAYVLEGTVASNVIFSRRPYTVTYMKNGERHTIRRRPPEKLHNIWPEDEVSLLRGKNADFQAGDEFEVKHINPRHPNIIQLYEII